MTDIPAYWHNFIDGDYCEGGTGHIEVLDPSTGERVADQALADESDVDRAVSAAQTLSASGAWSDLRPVERGRVVRKMGEYILDRSTRSLRS